MNLLQPNSLEDLFNLLLGKEFKTLQSLRLLSDSGDDFFTNIEEEFDSGVGFPTYIPIVKEMVATKKHQYTNVTHIVYWLNGEPFINTPPATIEHNRVGGSLKKTVLGAELGIPSNCNKFYLINIRTGKDANTMARYHDISVTRYSRD